jgi:hypothetical protein
MAKTIKMNPEANANQLTEAELIKTQTMQNDFNKLKSQLADAELQKHSILRQIDFLREGFADHEHHLISKYGKDAIINIQTGEVTRKENG